MRRLRSFIGPDIQVLSDTAERLICRLSRRFKPKPAAPS